MFSFSRNFLLYFFQLFFFADKKQNFIFFWHMKILKNAHTKHIQTNLKSLLLIILFFSFFKLKIKLILKTNIETKKKRRVGSIFCFFLYFSHTIFFFCLFYFIFNIVSVLLNFLFVCLFRMNMLFISTRTK